MHKVFRLCLNTDLFFNKVYFTQMYYKMLVTRVRTYNYCYKNLTDWLILYHQFSHLTDILMQLKKGCVNSSHLYSAYYFWDNFSLVLNGNINKENCGYWSDKTVIFFDNDIHKAHKKIDFIAGLYRIIGPLFIEEYRGYQLSKISHNYPAWRNSNCGESNLVAFSAGRWSSPLS